MHQNDQIMEQFLAFARLQGVNIDPDRLQADGRIHRADVGDLPSGKNDAGYLLRPDGTGWVTNFKADGKPIKFRPELTRELTPEETARIEMQREAWRRQQAERQAMAVEEAIQRWENSHEPKDFPYLQVPMLDPAGLRQGRAQLLVPMMAIDAAGEPCWVGMQRITWAEPGQSADKRFVSGTPTKGAFAIIPIVGSDVEAPLRAYEAACKADQVVLCEGIGTALAIHQATGLPVIAALSAQNLPDVARSLHDKLQGRAVIYADNDGEKAQFKGQAYAVRAARMLGGARTRIALPEKQGGITPPGYDARDQLRDSGSEAILKTMAATLDARQLERRFPHIAGRHKPGLAGQQAQQQGTAQPQVSLTNHQEQSMNNKTPADIETPANLDAQIKDTLHSEPVQSPEATPEAQPVDARSAAEDRTGQPDDQGLPETPEERLLREYAALADPVRAQRAKAQYDLDAKHREQREALFGSLEQLRADKMRELSGMAEEHQRSLIAIEVAKAVEAMQKRQMSERRSLQSELPDVPSYRNFLEDRAANDPVAARMLQEELARAQTPEAVKGKRAARVEPAVLEGLTHEIEDSPDGKAIHYARDGERVMSDRGERVDLYKMDDREIEAALRLAEQKYDMDKGLVLTGSREFQRRAAEIAGRMGLKIQNEDLRKAWEQGRLTALQADEAEHALAATAMSGSAGSLGSIARPSSLEAFRAQAATYPVDQPFLAAESVLSRLTPQGWDALAAAGQGHPLTPEQKALLEDPERPALIDAQDKLTELGQLAYDRMQARAEDERERQQQLRTRNIDEEMEKREREKVLEQQTTEHKEEAAVERQIEERQIEAPAPALSRRSLPRSRDMGRGM